MGGAQVRRRDSPVGARPEPVGRRVEVRASLREITALCLTGVAGRDAGPWPRRRPARRPTSRGTLRCSLWRRDTRASPGRGTTKRSTGATSSLLTSCEERSTRSRPMISRSTAARSSQATTVSWQCNSADRSSGWPPRRASPRPTHSMRSPRRRRVRCAAVARWPRTNYMTSFASVSARTCCRGARAAEATTSRRCCGATGDRFLHFYGPSDVGDFAEWSGVARPHAKRLWDQIEGDLSEVSVGSRKAVGGLVADPPLPAAQAARHRASPPERTFVTHPLALRRPRIAPPPRPRGRLAIVVMAERRVVTRDHAPAQLAEHPVEGLEHGIPQT